MNMLATILFFVFLSNVPSALSQTQKANMCGLRSLYVILTNAAAEGLNRIIRMVKNRASGFKTLDAFADLIYLCVGDLDIPAQIPARFRTV